MYCQVFYTFFFGQIEVKKYNKIMSFPIFLKKLREKEKISPTQLARKIGVTPSYIMNIEAGRGKPPSMDRIDQIAEVLQLSYTEKKELSRLAAEGRVKDKEKNILKNSMAEINVGTPSPYRNIPFDIPPEISEALEDKKFVEIIIGLWKVRKEEKAAVNKALNDPHCPKEIKEKIYKATGQ